MAVRIRALGKLGLLALLAIAIVILVNLAENSGVKPGRWRALPVVPVVLCQVPLLELVFGVQFVQISTTWNRLASWQQWASILVAFVAFFALFTMTALVLAP